MLSLKANVQNTIDFSKIQKAAEKAAVDILVGFPSGRMHVETKHKDKKGKNGKYKNYNGQDATFENMETAELAKILSFGAANIPARPFLEEGILSKKDELAKALKTEATKVIKGTGQANWNKVGTMAVGAISEFVRGDYYKTHIPNSPRTIKYKEGKDTPLIDGGDLIGSLEFIVR
jgi:hypothetical protein